jgi:cation diffusion facilitator CzcD-associated flavoprotein CzcO
MGAAMTHSGDSRIDRSIASNVSLWESPYPAMGKLVPPVEAGAQVCVIGAGITGLTTESLLAMEGRKLLVLEEREIGGGQFSKTTAHLASALDDRFSEARAVTWRGGVQNRRGKPGQAFRHAHEAPRRTR